MKNRLHVLRAERDWTQADLAKKLSVSRQAVNAIETGRSEPSLSLAFKIAKLFGTLIEDVFLPEGRSWPQSFGT
jgi:putative transcriptional regulator